ncbi:hypothetical protein, partial [Schauerella aestuarii]|uniref:hypothetical protein n=1 Tax=Schauerella aestuarii TaxID=2511204 RepID=UPI001F164CC2
AVSFGAKLHCKLKLCYILWLGSCREMRVNPKGYEAIQSRCRTIDQGASGQATRVAESFGFQVVWGDRIDRH